MTINDMMVEKLFGSMGCTIEKSYELMMGFKKIRGDKA